MLRELLLLALASSGLGFKLPSCRNPSECYEERMHPDFEPRIVSRAESSIPKGEETSNFWLDNAKTFVEEQLNRTMNRNYAKNVIFFIGDGMSIPTLAATRNYLGGEEVKLSFEKFPYVGLARTYAVDRIVPDSAATATSYLCGVKANYNTIGINAGVLLNDCNENVANRVTSIAKWSIDAGKSAGVVTTTRVTHASPAGTYASVANRNWENNVEMEEVCGADSSKLNDIAEQLVHGETGKHFKVILGGGKREFIDSKLFEKGRRKGGTIECQVDEIDRLLGLFTNGHMKFHLEDKKQKQPTLAEMTQKAIEMLRKDENGYFLFVEGGKIDIAHHDTSAIYALDETAEFSKAIELARQMTSEEDTLIVVSSDHSHTMSFAGYDERHGDIFGDTNKKADDEKKFLKLSYANGQGFDVYYNTKKNQRRNPKNIDRSSPDAVFPSTLPKESETHGGDDVAVFASGPWSHLFTGAYEQNVLPHLMAYASCVGSGQKSCDN
uniref:Alkaline phosphatase n=1 Tax=Megaselia scalaris TaxID=36166 RepID=T1GFD9_MEGSC